jgi:hypothetical protein
MGGELSGTIDAAIISALSDTACHTLAMVEWGVSTSEPLPDFEEVFTVTGYYDGPRQGIANFQGQPHFYDCAFAEHGPDYSNVYWLTPVRQEIFLLAMEDWAIWKRWERTFHAGEVTHDSHPALPAERNRHQHIRSLLSEELKTDMKRCIIRSGAFANAGTGAVQAGVLVDLVVRWSEPNGDSDVIWAD